MKILFWGSTKGNGGPSSVNRGIVSNFTPCFWKANAKNKYVELLEAIIKCILSDVVVVSCGSKQGILLMGLAKLLGKKCAYIMHGCAEYEIVVNAQENCEFMLPQERFLLKHTDLILPVSKKFRDWVCERYPQYAYKTKYLYNGIDKRVQQVPERKLRIKGSVAADGADRGVKNNIVVTRVIEQMAGKAYLTVYGSIDHGVPTGLEYTKYVGMIPHSEYIRKLQETELFVVNSIFETFSISAIEAICCGCSILISEIVGVTDLLALEESDIIHDPMNEQEIREKIEYLLEHPNNERIMSKLDLDEYSYEKSVKKLEQMCRELFTQ